MPMKAWIIHLDDTLEDTIRTAMPGVKWTEWQPKIHPRCRREEDRGPGEDHPELSRHADNGDLDQGA